MCKSKNFYTLHLFYCGGNETVMSGFWLKSSLNCGYGHIEEKNETRSTIFGENGHMQNFLVMRSI